MPTKPFKPAYVAPPKHLRYPAEVNRRAAQWWRAPTVRRIGWLLVVLVGLGVYWWALGRTW